MVVKNGDESHGFLSAKKHQLNKFKSYQGDPVKMSNVHDTSKLLL